MGWENVAVRAESTRVDPGALWMKETGCRVPSSKEERPALVLFMGPWGGG